MTNGICRTQSEKTAASDQRRTLWIGQEVKGGREEMGISRILLESTNFLHCLLASRKRRSRKEEKNKTQEVLYLTHGSHDF